MKQQPLTPQELAAILSRGERTAQTRIQAKPFLDQIATFLADQVGPVTDDVGTKAQSDARKIKFIDRAYFYLAPDLKGTYFPQLCVYLFPGQLWWGLHAWGKEAFAESVSEALQDLSLASGDEIQEGTGAFHADEAWGTGSYVSIGRQLAPNEVAEQRDTTELAQEIADDLADWWRRLEPQLDTLRRKLAAHIDAAAEPTQLAEPFASLFRDWEHAELVLDFFAESARKIGFEEHPDRRFALTMQSNRLGLNFAKRLLLNYLFKRDEFNLALLVDTVPEEYNLSKWNPRTDTERHVAVHQVPVTLIREFPEWLQHAHEESMRYIGGLYGHWEGTPYRYAHQQSIFEALFDEEKRHKLLASGLPDPLSLAEERRYWRITLPTELVVALPDGTERTLNAWEICRRHNIAAIGFGGDTENFQVRKFMEIKPGDGIVSFLRNKTIGGVGCVISSFDEELFEERPAAADYFNGDMWFRIGVDWQPYTLDVDSLPEPVANKFVQQTVLELSEDEFQTVIEKLEKPYGEQDFLAETHLTREKMDELRDMLHDKKQLILYGPPGTGKTYVAQHLARLLTERAEPPAQQLEIVQFHPAYGYEDFIEGIRPRSKPAGDGRFIVNYPVEPGAFRRFCQTARTIDGPCIFIVDEINRGNIPRIFGELMLLLEYRDQRVTLPYSGEPFSIPENVYIIGTMNTADRSIALVDFALRRRFHFFRFDADPNLFERWLQANPVDIPYLARLYRRLSQDAIDDPNFAIGPSHFMDPDLSETKLERIWRRSVIPYLQEYYFDQPAKAKRWEWSSDFMLGLRGEHNAG